MTDIKTEDLISAVEKSLDQAIEKYQGQVQESKTAANEVRDEVKSLAEKHSALVEQSESLAAKFAEFENEALTSVKGRKTAVETWGKRMIDSESFKSFLGGETKRARIEVKNTILGESGSPQGPDGVLVQFDRQPGIYPGAFRSLNILDFVPTGQTTSNAIEYVREIPADQSPPGFTNAAAERAEGTTKPESDLLFEKVDDPVRTIPTIIKVSRQVMEDAPALATYIDRRLRHAVQARLQKQILAGNGTSPNIAGLNQAGRHTAFTPASGDNQFDSVNRAKYAIIGQDFAPSAVLLNPANWGDMERLKRGSGDEAYVAGEGAALSYINNGLTPVLWGMPVVASNDVPEDKFFVMDPNAMLLFMRQGATVEVFEQDEDNVQKNLLTVRAELRAALAVFNPLAIAFGDLTL